MVPYNDESRESISRAEEGKEGETDFTGADPNVRLEQGVLDMAVSAFNSCSGTARFVPTRHRSAGQ